jgi:hypothetical protein
MWDVKLAVGYHSSTSHEALLAEGFSLAKPRCNCG